MAPSLAATGAVEEEGEEQEGDELGREALEHTNGEAALRFRHSQQVDENGNIPPNALVDAAAHVDRMKAFNPSQPNVAGLTRADWQWLGPGNIGGRIRSILIHPTTPDTMWIGSVTGGIFKTTNGGGTWIHLDDFMSNLAVSSLVAHPSTPNTLYAGTGEYTAGNNGTAEGNRGAGVFKSVNGGPWTQLSSTANSDWWYTNRLAVHPTSADTVLAATWAGIFRTVNGGTSWAKELSAEVVHDVDFDPSNGNNAIAGGYSGKAFYSTDGGDSWQPSTGLPAGAGRVEVGFAASNTLVTYASININGGAIYRSSDGGHSYTFIGPSPDVNYLGGQGNYDNALWVSPSNPDRIIVGGIDLYQSTNQGVGLTKISDWTINQNFVRTGSGPDSAHADHHAIVANPSYPTSLAVFFGNDGGIFKAADVTTVTTNSGWQELNNNLGITQFYGAAGSVASGKILGGTQDNGTLRYNGATETWNMTFGGDGGFNGVDTTNSNYLYGEYVYGAAFRSSDGGVNGDYISGLTGFNSNGTFQCAKAAQYEIADMCNQTANFIAPLVLDPNNPQRVLVGGVQLWRTNDARTANTSTTGPTWTSIKPATGTSSPISAIDIHNGNSNLVYVGHNNGLIYKTTNATAATPTWTRVDLDAMPSRMVLGLTIDPSNPNVVYATFGGFAGDNVWRLSDGDKNWTDRTGSGLTGLPDIPARSVAVNPTNANWIYLGTELGVFASEDAGQTWRVPQDGPANVPVDELFVMGDRLVAATHGRGVFRASIAATAPGAPTNVQATAGDAAANVSWTAPASDGGSVITGYEVTPYIGSTPQVSTSVENVTATQITGLTNGTTYTFKVKAVNGVGAGPESAASNAVTPTSGQPPVINWAANPSVDFDGDRKTDMGGLYRGLSPADSLWFALSSGGGGPFQIFFGATTDVPVPGDYNGDGKTDAVIFRPQTGLWYGPQTGAAVIVIQMNLGQAGDIPIPGDYDGDGKTDPAIWRPSTGLFFAVLSGGGTKSSSFGVPTDVPVPRDYDGDGKTDFAIYRQDATPDHLGLWYSPLSGGGLYQIYFGAPGDVPVPGDYNGDLRAEAVINREATGLWYGPLNGAPGLFQLLLGGPGDVPIPGYYDNNLSVDPAIYHKANGLWFALLSGGGVARVDGLGLPTDVPVQKRPTLAGGL
jgi:hypothetical protein